MSSLVPPRASLALSVTAAVAIAALAAGCSAGVSVGDKLTGPGGSSRPDLGTSTSTASGALDGTVTGIALYGDFGASAGTPDFQLALGSLAADSTFDDVVVIARPGADLPAAGTYALGDGTAASSQGASAFVLYAKLRGTGGGGIACYGSGGSLKLTAVGGGRVQGTYTAAATCTDAANPAQTGAVTISGSFDAVEGTKYLHVQHATRGAVTAPAMARAHVGR